ncbi:MAG TPA: M28 family peptidase [Gemmatimonadales bacterium]|nr:M28 family peptidase [Gemmatimonadales bacterium]
MRIQSPLAPTTLRSGVWLSLVIPALLQAQTSAPLKSAAGTITPADIKQRIFVIADDSMMGRDTPSPGLEKTAQYVADQFKKFGLKPGGENGTWFQRYTISRRRIDPAQSHVGFMIHGKHVHAELARDARFSFGTVPSKEIMAPVVLLGGAYSAEDVRKLEVRGKIVLVVIDYSKPLPSSTLSVLQGLAAGGAAGVVTLSNRDSATFARMVGGTPPTRSGVDGLNDGIPPVVEVHQRILGDILSEAGIRPDEIRASGTLITRAIPDLTIGIGLKDEVLSSATAPNTIGILEGSDPKLKNEYLVFSAHMDHVGVAGPNGTGGCSARGADSICNGADDDGSGTVGVVELAEAFSRPGARPKRSVIFMTVSGEEKGLYGSSYFTSNPTIPISQMVADLNIDMIGRNWPDTIVAIGKEHSDLGQTLNRIAGEHKNLNMAPIDDRWPEENFYYRSDHFNFARNGVPILFFFNGVHPDYHQVSDSPDKIDTDKMSRILQLLFYLGQDVANNPARPKWNPESYEKIVQKKPAA